MAAIGTNFRTTAFSAGIDHVHTHSRTAQREPERSHALSARSSASRRVGAEFALHGVARSRFSLPMARAPQ